MQKHEALALAAVALGVAGSIVTITDAARDAWWLAGLGLVIAGVVLGVGHYKQRNMALKEIKEGLKKLDKYLKEHNLYDCIFVAFDRTGSAFAAMLACHCGNQEVLTLNRYREADPDDAGTQRIVVGEGVVLDGRLLKKPLVVVGFHISTGKTLEAGLQYLKEQHCSPRAVLTLYITPGAKARWRQVVEAYEHPSNAATLQRLPWVIGPYKHV